MLCRSYFHFLTRAFLSMAFNWSASLPLATHLMRLRYRGLRSGRVAVVVAVHLYFRVV